MLRKIMATLLSIAMLASVGTTVMAADEENTSVGVASDMVLVGSYTETYDDYYVEKELYVNPEQFARGFSGLKYGTAVNSTYSNGGRTLEFKVIANATFSSQNNTDLIYLSSGTYQTLQYGNWRPHSFKETSVSNASEWGTKYAEYSVKYDHTNGTTGSAGRAYVRCDSVGNMDDSTGNYRTLPQNQVIIGDTVISFG